MDKIKEKFEKWFKEEFEQDYEDAVEESKCFPEVAQVSHIEDSYTTGHKEGEVVGCEEGRKETLEEIRDRILNAQRSRIIFNELKYIYTELKKLEGE